MSDSVAVTIDFDLVVEMRVVRVRFADSQYDFRTHINGSINQICGYYGRGPLNVAAPDGQDNLQRAIAVDFFDSSEADSVLVSVDLFELGYA